MDRTDYTNAPNLNMILDFFADGEALDGSSFNDYAVSYTEMMLDHGDESESEIAAAVGMAMVEWVKLGCPKLP
jgi:hypothetical protein